MKTWHIWDFPDTVYVYLKDDFKNEFFNKMFEKCRGKRPYARFLNISQMAVKNYYRGYTRKNGVKHQQAIPISLFKKSTSLIDTELKEKIENSIFLLKAKNRGIPIINPKLPIKESQEFYRIVAHMIGDGCAAERKVPYYANTRKELREQFRNDLNIFGELKSYERKLATVSIICFPKVVTDLLSHILEIKFSSPDHIPKQIFSAAKECKASFLRALFDDEGTISTNLAISMSNLNLVKDIKLLIESLGIETNALTSKKNKFWKDNFAFTIKRKHFVEFRERVGFSHQEKIKNLDAAIHTRNRKQRTRDIKEIKKQILEVLDSKSFRTIEIANILQRTLGHTLCYLDILEKENKIVRNGFKNKILWSLSRV